MNLFDPDKSSKKHDAALRRLSEGQLITFLSEESFFDLVKKSQD